MAHKLQRFTFNLDSPIRHDTLDGRPYIVVPMVMITEGVHNGSNGPLYYPKEELAKTPVVWNHKPIVVYHPDAETACDPAVLEARGVGMILNTKYKQKKGELAKLTAEAWLEESRVKKVDNRILDMLDKKQKVEVSTGVFTDNELGAGEWEGEDYVATARNYRPDHLAILPDQLGACSILDGAGLLQLNAAQQKDPLYLRAVSNAIKRMADRMGQTMNGMSYSNICDQLYGLLQKKYPSDGMSYSAYVEDVYSNFFVYCWGGELYQMKYLATDTEVTLVGEPTEVERVTEYRTPDGAFVGNSEGTSPPEKKESGMDKKKFVTDLIANSAGQFLEDDREYLEKMDETRLSKFIVPAKPAENNLTLNADGTPKVDPAKPPAPAVKPAEPVKNEIVQLTDEQFLATCSPAVREDLMFARAVKQQQKDELIGRITANTRNTFTKENLAVRELHELQALATLAGPDPAQKPPALYYGQAGGVPQGQTHNQEPLLLPTWDSTKEVAKEAAK